VRFVVVVVVIVVVVVVVIVEYCGLLGCNTVWFSKEVIRFQRHLLSSPVRHDVTACSLAENSQWFRGLSYFHLQGRQFFHQIISCHISENRYLDR